MGRKTDGRAGVLPHACIAYLKETDEEVVAHLIRILDDLPFSEKIELKIDHFGNYGKKIVAMFEPAHTAPYAQETEQSIFFAGLSGNAEYVAAVSTPVGDHMKIARNLDENLIEEVKMLAKQQLPETIVFDRVVLIECGCTEEDILWQRKLS